jgi:IclR family acetate operon transcriptional repressor
MFTEVGRRVNPHCTGVGKALLAQLPDTAASDIIGRTGMPAHTPHTITDAAALLEELGKIRRRGYALDDEEQEIGVRCVAVPLTGTPTLAAISISGPQGRLPLGVIDDVVPIMRRTAGRLSDSLSV